MKRRIANTIPPNLIAIIKHGASIMAETIRFINDVDIFNISTLFHQLALEHQSDDHACNIRSMHHSSHFH